MRARPTSAGPALAAASAPAQDWQHAAAVPTTATWPAERWARACFEGAPRWMRLFLTVGWRLLVLEGKVRSDTTHILGWPITSSSPETVVLRRRSRLGINATLVFTAHDDVATFASGMTFDHRAARIVWAGVAPTHRWAVRTGLGHAAAASA